jgi:HEPN domain-containing protein
MAARVEDWLRQAEHDFGVTETTAAAGQYDWACFAAQQAAEKALKALYQHHHSEGWGHSLDRLIAGLVADEPDLASSEKPRRS